MRRDYTPILLIIFFALLTGASFWALRLSTLHYGQARLEQGIRLGVQSCPRPDRTILPNGVIEEISFAEP